MAEPATIPPPIARSNSASPLGSRSGSAAGVSRPTKGITRPPPCRLCLAAKMLDTSALSCTSVFHSAQSGHCPCQRCWTDPQAWHVYRDLVLAFYTPPGRGGGHRPARRGGGGAESRRSPQSIASRRPDYREHPA